MRVRPSSRIATLSEDSICLHRPSDHRRGRWDSPAAVFRIDRAARVPCSAAGPLYEDLQIPTADVLLAWWYGLVLGAERFAHRTRYRRHCCHGC